MKINEVKETIERVVRTEYIAEDGEVFRSEEECKKYEESALFAVSKELKRLGNRKFCHGDIDDGFCTDDVLEIFDIQTEKDLNNLKRYLYLVLKKNMVSDKSIEECFKSVDGKRKDFVFENVTFGHEVMIFWNYDMDWFWVYRDGSIEGFNAFHRDEILKLIAPGTENENA